MKKLLMLTCLTGLVLSGAAQTEPVQPAGTETAAAQPPPPPPQPPPPVQPAHRVQSEKKIRINLYAAYVFDDKFDYYQDSYTYYDGKVEGGLQWGGGIEYLVQPSRGFELFYLRQDTYAPTKYQGSGQFFASEDKFELDLNYIMLASVHRLVKERVEGFFAPYLGMAIIEVRNPSNGNDNSATKFAWGAKLGLDIGLTNNLKLKLQGHLTSPVQAAGGSLYFGTGGSGLGLGLYSTLYQFALGGGLVFVPN